MSVAFRERLRARELLFGAVVTLSDVRLAELTAAAADFVWIDLEHGALGTADVQPLAVAARAAGTSALARVSSPDCALDALLDAGVDGIVAPRVETPADAERVVRGLRYPPSGSRGFAGRRPPRGEPACVVQIESWAAARNAEQIAQVDGVDALVVGCADLSLSLGEDPGACSPALAEAVALVQDAAGQAGIASGVAGAGDPQVLHELAGERSTCIVVAADVSVYERAVASALSVPRVTLERARA